jgi:hypothetical protein
MLAGNGEKGGQERARIGLSAQPGLAGDPTGVVAQADYEKRAGENSGLRSPGILESVRLPSHGYEYVNYRLHTASGSR